MLSRNVKINHKLPVSLVMTTRTVYIAI